MNFLGMGGFELVVIAGLAFFLLGPKKMIEVSRNAGKIIRDLKNERDKLTRMVMQEFDLEAEKPGAATSASTNEAVPDGAISRTREQVTDAGGGTDAENSASPDSADGPDQSTGRSA